jgi:polyferredoxin
MGTVKDAIHLYGSARAIFPPRMVALAIFLIIVFLVNKYICSWGCQLGVLQDLIFRINQTDKRKTILGEKIKPPFVLTNTIRILFLGVFSVIAFAWATDIIEPIDPFKVFKPAHLGLAGAIFAAVLLTMSLFVYRPWCHFFCPFGLTGWLVEKISLVKISVDYETCIACQKCAAACPSTVMGAILRRDKKTIPDCFSCYTCRDVCPTGSISFSTRERTLPPLDHFDKKEKSAEDREG